MKIKVAQNVDALRRGNYPSADEQHGATMKLLEALIDTLTPAQRNKLPQDALDVLAQVRAVKEWFPKP